MYTFSVTGPLTLDVRLVHGSVSVHARDGLTEATVSLTPHPGSEDFAERIAVELRGDSLVVHAPRHTGLAGTRGRRHSSVDAEITVPTGTALKLATHTADITLSGRSGAADVVTGSGDLRLDTVDGDLRLRTGSSDTEVLAVTGSAHVRAGSGDVRFGNVGGSLDTASGSGRLDIEVIRGALRSRCGSGAAVVKAVYGDVDLLSGSGAMTIGLPAGVSVRLDVTSGSGTVSSELPLDNQRSGTGPAITVRARTGSGDLTLVRAA